MDQIKIFREKACDMSVPEKKVNDFLAENEGKIVVKDIKYQADTINPNNAIWAIWNIMIWYETK